MRFKGVLLDISGVIYVGDKLLPGALDAINRLRTANLSVRYVTNTTSTSKRSILAKITGLGVDMNADELFTPAQAACALIKREKARPHLLINPDLMEDFASVRDANQDGDTVVVIGDAGEDLNYQNLNAAFHQLRDGAGFLALAANRTFKDDDGEVSLDTGAFVAALEFASQRKPIVLGKPAKEFFHSAVAHMQCSPGEAVMVGDDAEADVAGAISAGLGAGVLVRTGKYSPGAEAAVDPQPTAVVDDLSGAVDWILGAN